MTDHDTIIAYRSRTDAIVDQYWYDFFYEHPAILAWIPIAIIVFILACVAACYWPRKRKDWRF